MVFDCNVSEYRPPKPSIPSFSIVYYTLPNVPVNCYKIMTVLLCVHSPCDFVQCRNCILEYLISFHIIVSCIVLLCDVKECSCHKWERIKLVFDTCTIYLMDYWRERRIMY